MSISPQKVIELFVYAIILILAVIWAINRGGIYKPPKTTPEINIRQVTEDKKTEPPGELEYALPPKAEFAPQN